MVNNYKHLFSVLAALLVMLFLTGGALACTIDVENIELELRSEIDGYDNTISAEDNDYIDVRLSFTIDNISGSGCPSSIGASGKIYRWDEDNDEWDYWKTITKKTQTLEEDNYTFTWTNNFSVSDSYEKYKVEGIIEAGSDELETEEAFIEVESTSCSGIKLVVRDFSIEEGESETEIFRIENNTSRDFEIDFVEISTSSDSSAIDSVNIDDHEGEIIDSQSDLDVDVEIEAGTVSYDRTITAEFKVAGTLGSTYCSYTTIGKESFDIRIEDTGSGSSTSTECDEIQIHANNFSISEKATSIKNFYIKNNSNKRFEITGIKLTNNGVALSEEYYQRYAEEDDIAEILVKVSAPSVDSDETYKNSIEVKGEFEDGRSCSYSGIGKKEFDVKVLDSSASEGTCSDFSIDVPSTVSLNKSGSIPITIINGTDAKANIIVESDLDVTPTLISLPKKTTISRYITVRISKERGTITLKPQVEGCVINTSGIIVKDTSGIKISAIGMSTSLESFNGIKKLSIEFDNPTDQTFEGNLMFSLPSGWKTEDRTIRVYPGLNTAEVELTREDSSSGGTGRVIFFSDGESISKEFSISEVPVPMGVFSGFFLLGVPAFIGVIVLLIIILLAIVLVGDTAGISKKEHEQLGKWEAQK